jgi:hypothetical protein
VFLVDGCAAPSLTQMGRNRQRPKPVKTASPSGRNHPDKQRRAELRQADPWTDVSFYASSRSMLSNHYRNNQKIGGFERGKAAGPDTDNLDSYAASLPHSQSWVANQAWLESLRYNPREVRDGNSAMYHIEAGVRIRVGLAAPQNDWRPSQLPRTWAYDPPGTPPRKIPSAPPKRNVSPGRISALAEPRQKQSQQKHLHGWAVEERKPDFRHVPKADSRSKLVSPPKQSLPGASKLPAPLGSFAAPTAAALQRNGSEGSILSSWFQSPATAPESTPLNSHVDAPIPFADRTVSVAATSAAAVVAANAAMPAVHASTAVAMTPTVSPIAVEAPMGPMSSGAPVIERRSDNVPMTPATAAPAPASKSVEALATAVRAPGLSWAVVAVTKAAQIASTEQKPSAATRVWNWLGTPAPPASSQEVRL